jgi:hypothetical protein
MRKARPRWRLTRATGLRAPCHQGIVAAYLSHLADAGKKASTIGRRCASIAWHHRQAGIEQAPTASPGVRAVLKGIRRTIGVATTRQPPPPSFAGCSISATTP